MNSQYDYLEKQLDSLKAASVPKKDELNRQEELMGIIHEEEMEINKLTQGSKKLKEKVRIKSLCFPIKSISATQSLTYQKFPVFAKRK